MVETKLPFQKLYHLSSTKSPKTSMLRKTPTNLHPLALPWPTSCIGAQLHRKAKGIHRNTLRLAKTENFGFSCRFKGEVLGGQSFFWVGQQTYFCLFCFNNNYGAMNPQQKIQKGGTLVVFWVLFFLNILVLGGKEKMTWKKTRLFLGGGGASVVFVWGLYP